MTQKEKMEAELLEIARKTLLIETLETRKNDQLDFHDLSVWVIKQALSEAYAAGKAA